ncbi:hypothetical protein ABW19_dt0209009 [Dactylella cylindrospora]|nr:hypothetical protein ABW19_dt0209009 [Dactylella cylindrospora]
MIIGVKCRFTLVTLEVGAISVEADVWVRNGDLLVGHDHVALTINRTFRSLYVNPILDTLRKQNPQTAFANNTRCGVFDTECFQTLYLWVDLKTGAKETWPLVDAQLGALREGNWLTKWDGDQIIPGPVTVIATGSASHEVLIAGKKTRDYFIDAPLNAIGTHSEPMHPDGVTPLYNSSTSIFASASLSEAVGFIWAEMSEKQKEVAAQKIKNANERGIEARFWETPGWPVKRRRGVWRVLVDSGVGLLNADDLEDAAFGDW